MEEKSFKPSWFRVVLGFYNQVSQKWVITDSSPWTTEAKARANQSQWGYGSWLQYQDQHGNPIDVKGSYR